MGRDTLTDEQLWAVIAATFEWWDGYYIPQGDEQEQACIKNVRENLNSS